MHSAMENFLSSTEIEELRQDHRAERVSRYADRIKCILVLDSGFSAQKVAEYLLLDEKTVRNYLERYLADGLEGLCGDLYLGRKNSLSLEELEKLEEELRSEIYPITSAIILYVKKAFGISYSISGMTDLLKRLKFSYKKPQAIPGKADADAQKEFLSNLEKLKQVKNAQDPILYIDSTHPQHNSHPDYGWLPKGENTNLKTNTGRRRVTLNGALDSKTHDIIVREDEILNAENTIRFFKTIERKYPCSSIGILCVILFTNVNFILIGSVAVSR